MTYNILKGFIKHYCFLLILSTNFTLFSAAQTRDYIRPALIDNVKEYKMQVQADPFKKMIELKSKIPSLIYDLRYATTNNFMHRRMYPSNTSVTFMRLPAVIALQKIQQELAANGKGLKIFDAYRPYAVTEKFWELVHDER